MDRFIPKAILIVFFICFIFFIWIIFNNVLYNPSGGIVSELDEMAADHMSGEQLDNWNEHVDNDDDSFGFFGVLLMFVLFLCLFIYAFKRKRDANG